MTREAYKEAVRQAKEHIKAGDIFQIVLSQRFERRTFADPFEIYRALRVVNPSPYMGYLQVYFCVTSEIASFIKEGFVAQLFSSSDDCLFAKQARGCILVASSPEILTRIKKVCLCTYYRFLN